MGSLLDLLPLLCFPSCNQAAGTQRSVLPPLQIGDGAPGLNDFAIFAMPQVFFFQRSAVEVRQKHRVLNLFLLRGFWDGLPARDCDPILGRQIGRGE